MAGGSQPRPRVPYKFLLDADISPSVAQIARALGLDTVSVYECDRGTLRDDEHLRLAAADGRIFVTRNRNDFIRWTVEFARRLEPHPGVLIVPRSVAATRPEPLARALLRWAEAAAVRRKRLPLDPYFLDFISAVSGEGKA